MTYTVALNLSDDHELAAQSSANQRSARFHFRLVYNAPSLFATEQS